MPVEEAADQLPATETTNQGTQEVVDRSGFLGDSIHEESLDTEQPETSVEGEETEVEAAQTDETQTEGEEESGETSVEEWLQDLTPRESSVYEKRYPSAWAKLNDPDTPEDYKRLLMDKVNSDRFIAEQKALIDSYQSEPIVQEEEAVETEPEPEQVATAEQDAKDYEARLNSVYQTFDQAAVTNLGKNVLAALGADFNRNLNDPSLTAEQRAAISRDLQMWNQAAPKLGEVLARAGADMIMTAIPNLLPQVLPQALDSIVPGMVQSSRETVEVKAYSNAYESLRRSKDDSGATPYANLPQYGTQEFFATMNDAAIKIAGSREAFESMIFTGKDGKALPLADQAKRQVQMLVNVARGGKANPAVVAKALDTGAKLATKTANKKAAGRALGAGNSSRSFDTSKGTDGFDAALDREIAIHNSNMAPLTSGRK